MKILILDIEGTDGDYLVSSDGDIFSKKRGGLKKLVPVTNSDGYLNVKINNVTTRLHRIVAKAFIDNPLNLSDVDHINGDKLNNSVSNLQWLSREDNVKKALQKTYSLRSPEGVVYTFTGLNEFCKANNLTQPNISRVISGERPSSKGWTKV